MALPNEEFLTIQLQCFLYEDGDANLHCSDVYERLAERFPCLTDDEISVPYGHSRSHWANRVQFARHRLVERKFLEPMHLSGRGYWKLTEAGRADVERMKQRADELLKELDTLH
jgi:hypothetical protein